MVFFNVGSGCSTASLAGGCAISEKVFRTWVFGDTTNIPAAIPCATRRKTATASSAAPRNQARIETAQGPFRLPLPVLPTWPQPDQSSAEFRPPISGFAAPAVRDRAFAGGDGKVDPEASPESRLAFYIDAASGLRDDAMDDR